MKIWEEIMLTLIICMLIGAALGYFFNKKENVATRNAMIFLGSFAGMALGFLVSMAVRDSFYGNEKLLEAENAKIVSLVGASEIYGQTFLLVGSLGAEDYYKFYYEVADGARVFMKLSKSSVRIYEEDRNDAYLTQIQKQRKSDACSLWVPSFFDREKRIFQYYAIHVPKGTIKSEINLDLK